MNTKEKILLFRCLFTLIAMGRLVAKKYINDERLQKQVNDQTSGVCKELSDYLNELYSSKQ